MALFLDVQKAFDTVSYYHALQQLPNLEVGKRLCCWIAAFLKDRAIHVLTNSGPNWKHYLKQGVLRGSIPSPPVFNLIHAELSSLLPSGVCITLHSADV